ncbi:cysteine proteinase [Marasmius fiardii PR-910]|nr:cysteine proteinase [Marasmius fiardii PR-910]
MGLFNLFKHGSATANKPAISPIPEKTSYPQNPDKAGLLVAGELEKALEECKSTVERIAAECRAQNRRFRDHEFDLETDRDRCLHGLGSRETYNPSDVQRVTQIFENPHFFIDGAGSNDMKQGGIGDCWFVSALATMSTCEGLVEKFCVAMDEEIGVYGFVFFRDAYWVTVIIDDFLFTLIPKFEELSYPEKQLYHHNKEKYNQEARKSGKGLYFAKPGTDGETWVPLIEKAYAKLHGSYGALCGGEACEAIEDLTGGVSTFFPTNDIFDINKFWTEELCKANVDRLFGCSYQTLDNTRSGALRVDVSGLYGNHAYSVLRAVEHRGKRFVVIRNPWGQSEWSGPWSDGSKEWTAEWLEALPVLGHVFGDDGQFVMEYKDFLDCWDQIDRTLLFDSSWVMSSQWLHVTAKPLPSAWTYGDVSCEFFFPPPSQPWLTILSQVTFTLPAPSKAVIVLSQLDDRYFSEISGRCYWTFDFNLYKKGEKRHIAASSTSRLLCRSVNLEVDLEAGGYVVHVC